MNTAAKTGLGVGAVLLALIAAAVYFKPAPSSTTTPPVASNTPPTLPPITSTRAPGDAPLVVTPPTPGSLTPSTQPSGFEVAPSTQPSGFTISGPATQPAGSGFSAPSTRPVAGSSTPGPRASWDAILAGAANPSDTNNASTTPGNTPGLFGPPPTTLPPTVGPRPGDLGNPAVGSGTTGTYTVQSGDSFSTIARKVYGNANLWSKIAAANPGVNPNRLKVGQILKVPADAVPPADSAPAARRDTPASGSSLVRDARSEYQVVSGDSLEKIARKLYGNPARWEEIYNLNRAAIGSSPTRLKIGMILKLPAAPTAATGAGASTPATRP